LLGKVRSIRRWVDFAAGMGMTRRFFSSAAEPRRRRACSRLSAL
jgi:hypothetical protein